LISGSFNHVRQRTPSPTSSQAQCDVADAFFRERTAAFAVEQIAGMNALKMGRWPMTTFGTLSTLTAYLSLAFVGAIVLGLL